MYFGMAICIPGLRPLLTLLKSKVLEKVSTSIQIESMVNGSSYKQGKFSRFRKTIIFTEKLYTVGSLAKEEKGGKKIS